MGLQEYLRHSRTGWAHLGQVEEVGIFRWPPAADRQASVTRALAPMMAEEVAAARAAGWGRGPRFMMFRPVLP